MSLPEVYNNSNSNNNNTNKPNPSSGSALIFTLCAVETGEWPPVLPPAHVLNIECD